MSSIKNKEMLKLLKSKEIDLLIQNSIPTINLALSKFKFKYSDDLLDLRQQIIIEIFTNKLSKFDENSRGNSFLGWVYTTSKNIIVTFFRLKNTKKFNVFKFASLDDTHKEFSCEDYNDELYEKQMEIVKKHFGSYNNILEITTTKNYYRKRQRCKDEYVKYLQTF